MGADSCGVSAGKVLRELGGALDIAAESCRDRRTFRCEVFRYSGADSPRAAGDQRHSSGELGPLGLAGALLGCVDGGGFGHEVPPRVAHRDGFALLPILAHCPIEAQPRVAIANQRSSAVTSRAEAAGVVMLEDCDTESSC